MKLRYKVNKEKGNERFSKKLHGKTRCLERRLIVFLRKGKDKKEIRRR